MNSTAVGSLLDPTIAWTLRIFLASVFARALVGKLRAPRHFVEALRGYELLPKALAWPAAALLLASEVVLIPALLLPSSAALAAGFAAGLLLLYATAIAINLLRGRRDIDCGCGGPLQRQSLHPLLVLRNGFLTVMAALATLPLADRPLIWVDLVTISVAAFALAALAIALDGLAGLAPGLEQLRART